MFLRLLNYPIGCESADPQIVFPVPFKHMFLLLVFPIYDTKFFHIYCTCSIICYSFLLIYVPDLVSNSKFLFYSPIVPIQINLQGFVQGEFEIQDGTLQFVVTKTKLLERSNYNDTQILWSSLEKSIKTGTLLNPSPEDAMISFII